MPPTNEEKEILDLLWENFNKVDAAAKAAARFEQDVHHKVVEDRLAAGLPQAEAGNINRVFSANEFNSIYQKYIKLSVDIALINKLGLVDYKEYIMETRIKQILEPIQTTTQKVNKVRIGDPETQLLMHLKEKILIGNNGR